MRVETVSKCQDVSSADLLKFMGYIIFFTKINSQTEMWFTQSGSPLFVISHVKLIKSFNIKFVITAISQSPKLKFALHIISYLTIMFFSCSTFKTDLKQTHLANFFQNVQIVNASQHLQKCMDYDPYRDIPFILCFPRSLCPAQSASFTMKAWGLTRC